MITCLQFACLLKWYPCLLVAGGPETDQTMTKKIDNKTRASKGGVARREALSADQRKNVAKKAAEERWAKAKGLPKETHSGVLQLGPGIPCAVLDNHMRVFSVNGLTR